MHVQLLHDEYNRYLNNDEKSYNKVNDGVSIITYTDTCAQTCVSDTSILDRIGIRAGGLSPTKHKIISVTEDPLNIKGVALVKISVNNRSTYQTLYIIECINGLFITKDGQIDIGILPPGYPQCNSCPDPKCETENNNCETISVVSNSINSDPEEIRSSVYEFN